MVINIAGYDVLIDDEDFEKAQYIKWHRINKNGSPYFSKSFRSKDNKYHSILLHRLIINAPHGKHVDHINGDTLDNRKSNLRICSRTDNNCNLKRRVDNTSGYKGVSFDKKKKKWAAYISKNKKRHFLGYFNTPKEAHKAYCKASKKYHGEFRRIA